MVRRSRSDRNTPCSSSDTVTAHNTMGSLSTAATAVDESCPRSTAMITLESINVSMGPGVWRGYCPPPAAIPQWSMVAGPQIYLIVPGECMKRKLRQVDAAQRGQDHPRGGRLVQREQVNPWRPAVQQIRALGGRLGHAQLQHRRRIVPALV